MQSELDTAKPGCSRTCFVQCNGHASRRPGIGSHAAENWLCVSVCGGVAGAPRKVGSRSVAGR